MNIEVLREKLYRFNEKHYNATCFTLDTDWASEAVLKSAFDLFDEFNVPFTSFVTHKSKIIEARADLEKGLHPNFNPDSSHGKTIGEVWRACREIVPETDFFRCHRYNSGNDIMDEAERQGMRFCSNICAYLQVLSPFVQRSGLVEFPVVLEDGSLLKHNEYLRDISEFVLSVPGIKILNFHPIHIAVNTPYFSYTREIKDSMPKEEYISICADQLAELQFNSGEKRLGIRDIVYMLIKEIKVKKTELITLNQLYERVLSQ